MDVFAVTDLALRMSAGKQRVHKTAIAQTAAPLAVWGDFAGSWTRRQAHQRHHAARLPRGRGRSQPLVGRLGSAARSRR